MLNVQNLSKSFHRAPAISGISFKVGKGESMLLLGPNGAGKTTLIRCVLGLIRYVGNIEVEGLDARKDGVEARRKIGYVPQEFAFYDTLTVVQQAHFISDLKGVDRAEVKTRLEGAGIWENRDKRTRALSSGMRQRLGLALALLGDPPLLIFDEPTSNVDLGGQLEFQRLVTQFKSEGKTILVTTHLSTLPDFADQAVVMNRGIIVAKGTPIDLLRKMNVMDRIYVKVADGEFSSVVKTMEGLGALNVETKAGWVIGSLAPGGKTRLLRGLLDAYNPEDLIVEAPNLESQYTKLFSETERN